MSRRIIARSVGWLVVITCSTMWIGGCRDDGSPTTPPPPVVPPPAPTAKASATPSPTLKPDEVVRLVTEAMGRNDAPAADTGIATAFAFASPGNRQVTGPLARFVPMVKSPTYEPLLTYTTIEYAPIRVDEGMPAAFLWSLSRQTAGEFKDCWMTDGVIRIGVEPLPPSPKEIKQREAPDIRV
jgi:hypothetical protein